MALEFNTGDNRYISFAKRAGIFLLTLYIFFILGQAVVTNWKLKKQIDQIKTDNANLLIKNHNLENLILYYQSDSFKELEARDKLGLKLPDEKVVMVPVQKYQNGAPQPTDETVAASIAGVKIKSTHLANWQAWWSYIFD